MISTRSFGRGLSGVLDDASKNKDQGVRSGAFVLLSKGASPEPNFASFGGCDCPACMIELALTLRALAQAIENNMTEPKPSQKAMH